MNFNNSTQLWVNRRKAELAKDAPLRTGVQVIDGHICHYRETLGRCTDTIEAEHLLADAEWTRDHSRQDNFWRP